MSIKDISVLGFESQKRLIIISWFVILVISMIKDITSKTLVKY